MIDVGTALPQARLLPGKTLETFDFATVPMLSKAHVSAITAGDSWIASRLANVAEADEIWENEDWWTDENSD